MIEYNALNYTKITLISHILIRHLRQPAAAAAFAPMLDNAF
uniref:Uncharacterized protein n=1 Tax=viral metagenome TaxID=1070528 RepID=A0A6C0I536_9ZZZZ